MAHARISAVLSGLILLAPASSFASAWDEVARRAAADVWERVGSGNGTVTHIDDDRRCAYFSGLPAAAMDTGTRVVFYRKTDTDIMDLGSGVVQSSRGILAWADVDTELGRRMGPGDQVRPDSRLFRIEFAEFRFESRAQDRINSPMSRIFRSLILHFLKRHGADVHPQTPQADEPTGSAPPAGTGLRLAGRLKMGPAGLVATIALNDRKSGELRFSDTYLLDSDVGFEAEEQSRAPIFPEDPEREMPLEEEALPGLLRLSISTAPSGESGMPAWPPRTPADFLLLEAIAPTLGDLGLFQDSGGALIMTLPPRLPEAAGARVDAVRVAAVLNARQKMSAAQFFLGNFKFVARPAGSASPTPAGEIELRTDIGTTLSRDIGHILSEPIFRMIDPAMPGIDMGLGAYRIYSSSPSTITLVRRPPMPWLARWHASPDTFVLSIDTDAKIRHTKFELEESDIHELSDAEFLKYTGSAAYLNRIVRSRSPTLAVLLFNMSASPFSDRQVRRSVSGALDRRAALEVLLNNRGSIASGWDWPASETPTPGARPTPEVEALIRPERQSQPESPVKRRESSGKDVLKKVPSPIRATLIIPEEDPACLTVAERIRADLRSLAMTVNIRRLTRASFEECLQTGQFEMALAAWPARPPYSLWLARHFASTGPENYGGFRNNAFDLFVDTAPDLNAAKDVLEIERPAVPLFWLSRYAVLGERVHSADFAESLFSSLEGIRPAP